MGRIIESVVEKNEDVILSQKGKNLAVIMSLKEYKEWKATLEEMQDTESLEALKRAEDDEKAGRFYSYSMFKFSTSMLR
ncbi:type II toxin-antitoxin system prevent-host-death family antitoxin [bacterium]|nr:type II toxin-antitoxin system prevent-host-death family antitoxin [bacterium]